MSAHMDTPTLALLADTCGGTVFPTSALDRLESFVERTLGRGQPQAATPPEPTVRRACKELGTDRPLVFISAKSEDSAYAVRVCEFLRERGWKVFLSSQSLSERGNSDYRAEIERNLEIAKHILVVTSSPEHAKAGWVEWEWATFCNEKHSGRKTGNVLTLVTTDIPPAALPLTLRQFQVVRFDPEAFAEILPYLG
jgi:hypothetical protein